MQTPLFLDFLPDDLSTVLVVAIILFIVVILWSIRTNKSRKQRRSRSFRDRYYQKREEKNQ